MSKITFQEFCIDCDKDYQCSWLGKILHGKFESFEQFFYEKYKFYDIKKEGDYWYAVK